MGAGLTLVLAEEAAAKPRRGQLQWQLRLTCSFAAYAWHVGRIGLLALAASSAQLWLRHALPSPPSARAVRVLDAGVFCAGSVDAGAFCAGGVRRLGGSVASACFAVTAFSSRGARCSTLVLSVLA